MTGAVKPSPLDAVRDHLDKGGSPYAPLVLLLAVLAIAGVLLLLHRLEHRKEAKPQANDPKALFAAVLNKLGLSVVQRDLLRRIAFDLRLPHPTMMLLSPELFQNHVRQWRQLLNEREQDVPEGPLRLREIAELLYGGETAEKVARLAKRIKVAQPQTSG